MNLIIVATGLLHDGASLQPEKTWRSLNAAALMRSFAVNAIGPALVAKHTLPLFQCDDRAIFAALSARVGSINDNRLGGWYGYRASKAALNQLIRTLSIESARKRKQAIYVGLHPGTVDSELSRPFQGAVVDGQLSPPRSRRTALAEYHRPTEDWRLWTLDRLGWYSRGSLPRFRRAFPSWDNGMSALNSVIEAAEARVARLFESWISSITETCLPGLIQARN